MRDFCDLTLIIDRSGSMSTIAEGTVSGLNKFIEEQKDTPGDGCWTIIFFDDQHSANGAGEQFPQVLVDRVSQDCVPVITHDNFVPRGSTALIDAVCTAIVNKGKQLANLTESERPSKVVFCIMTDGHENCSRNYLSSQMAEMIAHQRSKYGWQFMYLGANQDSFAVAGSYGIAKGSTSNFAYSNYGAHLGLVGASAGIRTSKVDGNDTALSLLTSAEPDKKPDVQVDVTVKT